MVFGLPVRTTAHVRAQEVCAEFSAPNDSKRLIIMVDTFGFVIHRF